MQKNPVDSAIIQAIQDVNEMYAFAPETEIRSLIPMFDWLATCEPRIDLIRDRCLNNFAVVQSERDAPITLFRMKENCKTNHSPTIFSNNGLIAYPITDNRAFRVWKELHCDSTQPIPVAPLVLDENGMPITCGAIENNRQYCFGRFCGMNLYSFYDWIEKKDRATREELCSEINRQIVEIRCRIRNKGCKHSDDHLGNFTVEFIHEKYLRHMLGRGYTINTLPYNLKYIRFSPEEYLQYSDKYIPVVRIIDPWAFCR